MNILIIDDNVKKAGGLARVLAGEGIDRAAIEIVSSAQAARDRLRANLYSMVVLDLLLPNREEDDPAIETSLSLLTDISDSGDLKRPRFIVGFTAYAETEKAASSAFSDRMWTIVNYDPTTLEWETQFKNVANYLKALDRQHPTETYLSDICFITAVPIETAAVARLPFDWAAATPLDDHTFIRRGIWQIGGESINVSMTWSPRMGSVASALLTEKIVRKLRPRFVVMPGICAGVKDKINLGDVVVFDPVWEWPNGKSVEGKQGTYLEPAPHQIALAEFLRARFEILSSDDALFAEIKRQWPSDPPETSLKLAIAPGTSGSTVIADNTTVAIIKEQHRKVVAVEMEAYGVFAAARMTAAPRPTAIVVKAVCDFADKKKVDKWQGYAAYTSTAVLKAFFERNYLDIRLLAGT